jgi:L-methionine (R)-S-oxide reductase
VRWAKVGSGADSPQAVRRLMKLSDTSAAAPRAIRLRMHGTISTLALLTPLGKVPTLSRMQNPTHSVHALDEGLRAIVHRFSADTGTLHLIDRGMLALSALHGDFPPPLIDIIRTIPIGKGMAGLAAERREAVTACNIQTDTSGDVRPGAKATGMEGAIVVPIIDDAGELRGTLGIANRSARDWTAEETEQLLACARELWLACASK